MQRRIVEKRQLELGLVTHLLALVLRQPVPLVDRQHDGASALGDEADQPCILLADVGMRVDHCDHHMGVLDGFQRFDDGKFLDGFADARAPANTRRIDEGEHPPLAFKRHFDGVARGARLVGCHHALFAEQAVDQRRFAHIRTPDDGHTNAPIFGQVAGFRRGRRIGQHVTHQFGDAVALLRGNRPGLAHAEGEKIGARHAGRLPFALVDNHHHRLAALAQLPRNGLVAGMPPGTAVDHEQHRVGLAERELRLGFGKGGQRVFGFRHQPAGVDHDKCLVFKAAGAVLAVTGQAGEVGHQGGAGAGQAVEQGGLAHVGAPDKHHTGQAGSRNHLAKREFGFDRGRRNVGHERHGTRKNDRVDLSQR